MASVGHGGMMGRVEVREEGADRGGGGRRGKSRVPAGGEEELASTGVGGGEGGVATGGDGSREGTGEGKLRGM